MGKPVFESSLDEAKYDVVHDFRPGGAVGLAKKALMSPGTLSNKVNPYVSTHGLMVDEAVLIQALARDCRILYAEAAELSHAAIPLGDYDGISDVELLDAYAEYHQELGETAAAVREALSAGKITRRAYEKVRREFFEDCQCGLEFLARLEALVDG